MIFYFNYKEAIKASFFYFFNISKNRYGLMFFLIFFSISLFSQNPLSSKVTFSCQNLRPEDALIALSEQTGAQFAFSPDFFIHCPPVSISVTDKQLQDVIAKISDCAAVSWKVIGAQIVFYQSERNFTLSGYLSDSESGERLIGASVRILPDRKLGVSTNEFGFFSLTLPEGNYTLSFSYIGCEGHNLDVALWKNTWINLTLTASKTIPEITVNAKNHLDSSKTERNNSTVINLSKLYSMPSLGGEPDVFRLVSLETGISSGVDGLGGLHIRGGNADQNLILLDDVPVYSPSHLFGMCSVFNPATLKSVKVWKGDAPANYGGRAASAFDIRTRDGDLHQYHSAVSAGLFASTLTFEGPIERGKSALLLSARTTYFSPWLHLYENRNMSKYLPSSGFFYRFHDVNLKFNRILSLKSRIYLSFYSGGDRFSIDTKSVYSNENQNQEYIYKLLNRWGNTTGAIRWNRILSPRCFTNTTLTLSHFQLSCLRYNFHKISSGPNVPPEFSGSDSTTVGALFKTNSGFGLQNRFLYFYKTKPYIKNRSRFHFTSFSTRRTDRYNHFFGF